MPYTPIAIRFADTAPEANIIAYVCRGEMLPRELEPVLVAGSLAAKFAGKPGQLFEGFAERDGRVVRIVLVGVGTGLGENEGGESAEAAFEKAGGALTARFLAAGVPELAIDAGGLTVSETVALLLAARLRGFTHNDYRTKLPDDQKPTLASIVVTGAPEGAEAAWAAAAAVAEGSEFTRALVTEPANVLYPETFVTRCEAAFAGTGVELTVLGPEEMAALGMGALLGVAQGSARPARLLALRWNGGESGKAPVALVGKGVTFDTGGISLKQPGGMEDMKWDMGGAGAVVGAMLALARRKARANVIGVCGLVENMPDALAQRPGDVVTSMSGQTIEVINTDAEGRLVLCDAITWVQREAKPCAIVDLATLTGAIIAALASEYGGLFANDDALAGQLTAAGAAVGEKLWRLPMGPVYDKMIESPIADMKNVGGRYAGSITAAQFIQRFVDKGTPWAHLDIAGMVWADKAGATFAKGATGYAVRLLDRYVRDNHEG